MHTLATCTGDQPQGQQDGRDGKAKSEWEEIRWSIISQLSYWEL